MARDFSKMSPQELEAIYQANFGGQAQTAQTAQPIPTGQPTQPAQAPQGADIQALLAQATQKPTMGQRFASGAKSALDAGAQMWGGVKPDTGSQDNLMNKYLETIIGEQAKQLYADPTVRQLREAEIEALKTPPPQGFVRVGKQTLADPNYVKPPTVSEQLKIDEEQKANDAQSEMIRGKAQQNLSSIEEAKKGSKYFGMLGGLPSVAAPSTWIPGGGNYDERKVWENNINQLLSQKVVDLITEMKQASKTGATGFGQLTEKEGAILREASTALSRDLPEKQALYYLNEMEKINKRILGIPFEETGNTGGSGGNDLSSIEAELAQINSQLGQ